MAKVIDFPIRQPRLRTIIRHALRVVLNRIRAEKKPVEKLLVVYITQDSTLTFLNVGFTKLSLQAAINDIMDQGVIRDDRWGRWDDREEDCDAQ